MPVSGAEALGYFQAQAQTEPLRLMTHDATVARYGTAIMLV